MRDKGFVTRVLFTSKDDFEGVSEALAEKAFVVVDGSTGTRFAVCPRG